MLENQDMFITNVIATYGDDGKNWIANLSDHIASLQRMWGFEFIKPIPNLSYGYVAIVKLKNNQNAILKTAPRGGTLVKEAHWLQSFTKGVPEVYAFDEDQNAFLMQMLEPGLPLTTLVKQRQDDQATRIIAQTIVDLQAEQKVLDKFQSLTDSIKDISYLNGHIPQKHIDHAQSLFQSMAQDCPRQVLLHSDLHHDNILQCGNTWKVIDPKGDIGPPEAEIGTMIRNPYDCFPDKQPIAKTLKRRIDILAEMLPFDKKLIKGWAFCITMLSAAWDVEGFGQISSQTKLVLDELINFKA